MDDEGYPTESSQKQLDCEQECFPYLFYAALADVRAQLVKDGIVDETDGTPRILRDGHVRYIRSGLRELRSAFAGLDASRPWMVYWMLHGLNLLSVRPTPYYADAVDFLARCQNATTGGFGGGPGQLAHCAPSYAAVLALATIGTPEAYAAVDRRSMYRWLLTLKRADGGVHIHADGEVDVRSAYTMLTIASLLNIMTPELTAGVAEWLASCQTYEGGFAGEPGCEAHGGYAFNAMAGLAILGRFDLVDVPALRRWLVARQLGMEGGFQGRTNKLVDGCYSFWQGALPAILSKYGGAVAPSGRAEAGGGTAAATATATSVGILYNVEFLQRYTLLCCQQAGGGLRDKPSKNRDFYHTCYTLSGLSIAQHYGTMPHDDMVERTDPVYNVVDANLAAALVHFRALPCTHAELAHRA
jgi:protein farnesyltransferase subunit beta